MEKPWKMLAAAVELKPGSTQEVGDDFSVSAVAVGMIPASALAGTPRTSDATSPITGGVAGQVIWVFNDGGADLTFKHGDGLKVPGGGDLVLAPGECFIAGTLDGSTWSVP